ncbi:MULTISPECIES: hypothetical protein [Burkholderia]|uniref:hypothetical protein n=1 Tax=Burkholderia TaxID=32008 RepID=UPI001588F00A|nr:MULTISPECIES: hypothetical protein [Burkholderia]
MAASEAAAIAAHVPAMNEWTVLLTSAVVASFINGGFLLWIKRGDREREDLEAAHRLACAQQEAMRSLEAFAEGADEFLGALEEAFHDYGFAEEAVFRPLEKFHLRLDLPSSSVLDALQRPLVDQLYEFSRAIAVSAAWLDKNEVLCEDAFDIWKLDAQRVVHFGLLACDLATRIRRGLDLPESDHTTALQRHFEAAFAKVRSEFEENRTKLLLPQIEIRLKSALESVEEG